MQKIRIIFKMAERYLSYKLKKPKPFYGSFCINYKCNLRCDYCPWVIDSNTSVEDFKEAKKNYFELTTEQAKYVIDQLDKLGVTVLAITGGEPLLRSDLEEIALYAKRKNILLWLDTNATLITKERAKSIGECFDSINISIAGKPETNDLIRGESFKKIEEGIENLRKFSKAKIDINFLVNRINFQEIDWVIDFARKKANSLLIIPAEFNPQLLLAPELREEVRRKLRSLRAKYGDFINNNQAHLDLIADYLTGKRTEVECDAFDLFVAVGPRGEFFGCCVYPYRIGNILTQNAQELLSIGKRRKKELMDRCKGCALPPMLVSLLFRQPFYQNIFLIKSLLNKTRMIPF